MKKGSALGNASFATSLEKCFQNSKLILWIKFQIVTFYSYYIDTGILNAHVMGKLDLQMIWELRFLHLTEGLLSTFQSNYPNFTIVSEMDFVSFIGNSP
jgi:hypothetical protein